MCTLHLLQKAKPKTTSPAQIPTFPPLLFGPFSTATMMSCPYFPQESGLKRGHERHIQRRTELSTHLHCPRNMWGSDIPAVERCEDQGEVSWQKATKGWKKMGFLRALHKWRSQLPLQERAQPSIGDSLQAHSQVLGASFMFEHRCRNKQLCNKCSLGRGALESRC